MYYFRSTAIFLLLCAASFTLSAQYIRTSFLMNDASQRLRLNPALIPSKGFFDIPVLGNINAAVSSNALGSQDIVDVFGGDADFTGDAFYNRLKDFNRMNLTFNTDVLSFGWWKGDNFWSVNAGLRLDAGANVPKSMFDFIRDMDGTPNWSSYKRNIENESLRFKAYTEIGVGYARALNERLTVGGKVKLLLGIGNLEMDIRQVSIETKGITGEEIYDIEAWRGASAGIKVDATLKSSLSGMKLTENNEGYIDDFDYDGFGIAGSGGAIDLGASYRVTDNLTVSASVSDLGFIKWKKSASYTYSAETERRYSEDNYDEFVNIVNNGDVLNFDLLGFNGGEETDSRSTSLYSSVTIGGEYTLLNDKVSVGALFTSRMLEPKTQSEITLGGAYRLSSLINLAISYSMIQSGGESLGLAVKLGPLFLGTDYMYFGKNTKAVNAFLGITVPLGKERN